MLAKKTLVKLKPCISSHSNPHMIARTRLLKCFVLQHIVIRTKHLRNLVWGIIRGFECLEMSVKKNRLHFCYCIQYGVTVFLKQTLLHLIWANICTSNLMVSNPKLYLFFSQYSLGPTLKNSNKNGIFTMALIFVSQYPKTLQHFSSPQLLNFYNFRYTSLVVEHISLFCWSTILGRKVQFLEKHGLNICYNYQWSKLVKNRQNEQTGSK